MSAPEPTVEVVAAGDAKTYRVTREGNGTYELALRPGWTEPRVRDLDLAVWLGFAVPRMIRKLISRHTATGRIAPMGIRSTVERIGRGRRADQEFWLTEREALFVIAKSKTEKADAVTMAMIDVFLAVRRGAPLPTPLPMEPLALQLSAGMAMNLREVATVNRTTPERIAAEILQAWSVLSWTMKHAPVPPGGGWPAANGSTPTVRSFLTPPSPPSPAAPPPRRPGRPATISAMSAEEFRTLRFHMKLTGRALARELGIGHSTVERYESGRGIPPIVATAIRLLAARDSA